MSQNARVGKSSPAISQVNVARISLRSHTIKDWQDAINSARNELMPRRKALYELYENLKLDGHLSAVMGKRTLNVTNKKVIYVDDGAAESLQDNIRDYILNTPWFYDFLSGSMEVVPFGTTLLELIPKAGMIERCEVFPRANVVPEFGHISQDAVNPLDPWLAYRDDKYYSTYLVEVGKPKDLGAMMIALPYVLYKRGAFGDWAQFAELFGMPFRVGKYNPWDESTRQKLLTALAEMGGAGYAVIPDGTSLDFHNANAGSNQSALYKDLVEVCNSELSKIFLGQTMTTDQGSSRSQGEVHERVEDGITLADMRRTEFLLNWELHPRLEKLGYPVSKGRFEFDLTRNLPLEKRIEMDMKVSEQLGGQIPARYWYDTYGLPEPGKGDKVIVKAKAETKEPETPAKEEKGGKDEKTDEPEPASAKATAGKARKDSASMKAQLDKLYTAHRHDGKDVATGDDDFEGLAGHPIWEEIIRAMHDGRIRDGWVDPQLMAWTAEKLNRAVFGDESDGTDPGLADDEAAPETDELRRFMRENVAVFSGFKTYHTLRAATDELMDEQGNFRTFAQFRRHVLAIDATYNKHYLRAEYNHAIAAAQMAGRWQEIQQFKDRFPYLRYRTVGDDRVRKDHDRLHGVIKPVDDPFWDTNYPPNGWNCRCDVAQVDSAEGGKYLAPHEYPVLRGMWANNVGKSGIVFPKGHPYYTAPAQVGRQAETAAAGLLTRNVVRTAAKRTAERSRAVANELAGDFARRVAPALPPATRQAITSYTQSRFDEWNDLLKLDPDLAKMPDAEGWNEIRAIRAAMDMHRTNKVVQVFRGVKHPGDGEMLAALRRIGVGGVYKGGGFMSTSLDPRHDMVSKRGKLVLRINVPAGARALYVESLSAKPEEMELLLDHNTKLRVLGFEERGGVTYVDLTVVP